MTPVTLISVTGQKLFSGDGAFVLFSGDGAFVTIPGSKACSKNIIWQNAQNKSLG